MLPVRRFEDYKWKDYAKRIENGERPLLVPLPENTAILFDK